MTTALDITDTEATALADLAVRAPSTLRSSVLVEVGLVDRYGRIDGSPLGPLVVAWNGIGVVSVDMAGDDEAFEARHLAATGRQATASEVPTRLANAIGRRLEGDRRVRIPLDLRGHSRLRAGRLAQGARDPAWRGPAVRLDRGGDRSAEGGPCRRHRARSQPRAAHRPVPPRGPKRRLHRSVLAGWPTEQANDPDGGGPRPRGDGVRRAPWRAARRLRVHEDRLLADLPYGAAHARAESATVPLARRGGRGRLPSVQGLPPGVGRGLNRPGRIRLARDRDPAAYPCPLDQPTMPTEPKAAPDPRLIWVGLAILYGVWGSTYLAISVGVQTIPPFLMAAARFGLAGLILLTWVALRDREDHRSAHAPGASR